MIYKVSFIIYLSNYCRSEVERMSTVFADIYHIHSEIVELVSVFQHVSFDGEMKNAYRELSLSFVCAKSREVTSKFASWYTKIKHTMKKKVGIILMMNNF